MKKKRWTKKQKNVRDEFKKLLPTFVKICGCKENPMLEQELSENQINAAWKFISGMVDDMNKGGE